MKQLAVLLFPMDGMLNSSFFVRFPQQYASTHAFMLLDGVRPSCPALVQEHNTRAKMCGLTQSRSQVQRANQ